MYHREHYVTLTESATNSHKSGTESSSRSEYGPDASGLTEFHAVQIEDPHRVEVCAVRTLSCEPEELIPDPAETWPRNSCGLRVHSRGQKARSYIGAQKIRCGLR